METTVIIPVVFTKREKEILELVAEGFTSGAIASQLFVSIRTVENHRVNMLRKLAVANTPSLLKRAREAGFI